VLLVLSLGLRQATVLLSKAALSRNGINFFIVGFFDEVDYENQNFTPILSASLEQAIVLGIVFTSPLAPPHLFAQWFPRKRIAISRAKICKYRPLLIKEE